MKKPKKKPAVCVWESVEEEGLAYYTALTGCGRTSTTSVFQRRLWNFCPYCGKRIKVKRIKVK